MIWRIVGLSALVSLVGVSSCADDLAPGRFTTAGTCAPGDVEECDCPGSASGKRYCTPSLRFGECACEGCTAAPDCDECDSCVDRCMCETKRVHEESLCRDNCIALGELDGGSSDEPDAAPPSDPGSGGDPPPPSCDPAACPAATGFLTLPGCCDAQNRCGYDFQGQCIATNQPGVPDPDCPGFSIAGFSLPGCCRPDETCGVQDSFLGFGCVDPSALGGGAPTPCNIIQ